MEHFQNEAQAERCGEHWLEEIKRVVESNSSNSFKARRIKLYADRAHMCFTMKLSELDRHAPQVDPNYYILTL